jgi:hypothetical protein
MRHSFYVYYKVEPENAQAARSAVHELFLILHKQENVRGRLLRRADDATTWMEIYEDVMDPQRFRSALDATVENCGLPRLTRDGVRHVEHFRECAEAEIITPPQP